ncbi:MAG: DUF1289 domain-containing protein [Magnetospirillum gryphiswaldense]|nr:DUF1289 domain-containing protein [Magnetospirillum gryphiswaldense]
MGRSSGCLDQHKPKNRPWARGKGPCPTKGQDPCRGLSPPERGVCSVSVESPCISVCQMDEDGYCIGCGRTIDEIRGWKRSSDEEKQEVLGRVAERQGQVA